MKPDKLIVYGDIHQSNHIDETVALLEMLRASDVTMQLEPSYLQHLRDLRPDCLADMDKTAATSASVSTLVLSIGGDGTFLSTVAQEQPRLPIMGINAGHLGYLSAAPISAAESIVDDILHGRLVESQRTMLEASAGNEVIGTALNEVAILRQDSATTIIVSVSLDSKPLADYAGDGLILSTPTGSTAYNLSAGGPIVAPDARVTIITPVAPHSLTMRPLVVRDNSRIGLRVESRTGTFQLALDGRSRIVDSTTPIDVVLSNRTVNVVNCQGTTFEQSLRNKLLWGTTYEH